MDSHRDGTAIEHHGKANGREVAIGLRPSEGSAAPSIVVHQ